MGEFVFTRVRRFLRRSSTSSVLSAKDLPTFPTSTSSQTAKEEQADPKQSDFIPGSFSAPTTPDLRGRRGSSAKSRQTLALERSSSPQCRQTKTKLQGRPSSEHTASEGARTPLDGPPHTLDRASSPSTYPKFIVQEPTPDQPLLTPANQKREVNVIEEEFEDAVEELKQGQEAETRPTTAASATVPVLQRPELLTRSQTLVSPEQHRLIQTLLQGDRPESRSATFERLSSVNAEMVQRKIWVKRPGQSATLVTVTEDDVVDDVREAILRKYGNSLGRSLDAPDITLRIVSREQSGRAAPTERHLGPEEQICRTLDAYFSGGQTVDEALIIEVPQRRTPKPSPRYGNQLPHYMIEETRAPGDESGYFPPMPAMPSPHAAPSNHSGSIHHQPLHSMSVLSTGQVPALPSPGGRYRHGPASHSNRPKFSRNHTSSPTVITSLPPTQHVLGILPFSRTNSAHTASSIDHLVSSDSNKQLANGVPAPAPPPLPTPPAPASDQKSNITPPGRVSSPRPGQKPRRSKKKDAQKDIAASAASPSAGLLDGTVPPINVLIVEDNVINLRLLEAFMKRLKVRWKTAVNGREAVNKWRMGGFHLVLMDIQLPVMSGLDATREIRRLERVNNIGVFSSPISGKHETSLEEKDESAAGQLHNGKYEPQGDDVLEPRSLFKSPVIVVALTASSLQSDRHEALAAGCNDFLTKVRLLKVHVGRC